ncbi:hypothetical protein KCU62_g4033, partial [Aureobasidium sp. EXF-3399]
MITKTDDMRSQSDDGIPDVPKTVLSPDDWIARARQDLSEVKEQLAAIETRRHDHSSCQECHSLEHKHDAAQSVIKELEAEREHLTRELEEAPGSVTGYKNSFAITDKILNEQQAEITEQKTKIVAQKVEITRLKIRYGEMLVPDFSPEDLVGQTGAVMHSKSGHPLVMRIDVWVGGGHGTDAELALVKMNPDTPFKAVLEGLRRHHPLKALKQKDTGRYIFESDTPAHLGVKDGEEFVFVQQNDEPDFMLDATMEGVKCWTGKDSRV